jgi:hypothetical protein
VGLVILEKLILEVVIFSDQANKVDLCFKQVDEPRFDADERSACVTLTQIQVHCAHPRFQQTTQDTKVATTVTEFLLVSTEDQPMLEADLLC